MSRFSAICQKAAAAANWNKKPLISGVGRKIFAQRNNFCPDFIHVRKKINALLAKCLSMLILFILDKFCSLSFSDNICFVFILQKSPYRNWKVYLYLEGSSFFMNSKGESHCSYRLGLSSVNWGMRSFTFVLLTPTPVLMVGIIHKLFFHNS